MTDGILDNATPRASGQVIDMVPRAYAAQVNSAVPITIGRPLDRFFSSSTSFNGIVARLWANAVRQPCLVMINQTM